MTNNQENNNNDTPSLPFTQDNLAILQEQLKRMKLEMSAATVFSAASSDVEMEMQSTICTTCVCAESNAPIDGPRSLRNNQNSIFCCAANKIICLGSGIDHGNNKETIQRFIKDVAHDEARYLSKEDVKVAFLACKKIIEVQRTVEERTQTRYFVPSIIYSKKYVEVHPRDMFYANPLGQRGDHIFMFLKCWDLKHRKRSVARRVTLLDKPHFLKGTEIYRQCSGEWFVSGPVENWGEIWRADDE